jgi:DNA-binding CsgD family transcriptional regulator
MNAAVSTTGSRARCGRSPPWRSSTGSAPSRGAAGPPGNSTRPGWSPRRTAGATDPARALSQLTPQELQIVRLAAQGLSNRDIAAQLFLSPRIVGYHLYKAYPKLGVAARSELPGQLNDD